MTDACILRVTGRAVPVRGDDIDTDRIIPARFLRSVSFEGLEHHLFEDDRAGGGHPLDDPRYRGARVMLVNRNFGCGSSREHAPQAILRWGVQAIVGESFSEIFFGNALVVGLPCVRVSRADAHRLMDAVAAEPTLELAVNLQEGRVTAGPLRVPANQPSAAREAFLTGAWDGAGVLRSNEAEVRATAARLPYLTGFRRSGA